MILVPKWSDDEAYARLMRDLSEASATAAELARAIKVIGILVHRLGGRAHIRREEIDAAMRNERLVVEDSTSDGVVLRVESDT